MQVQLHHLIVVFSVSLAVVDGLDHVKFGASRVIQPNPCGHERTGEEGVCMFAWDCLNLNGTHITFCRDRFYYGSCCKLPEGIQPPNRMPPTVHNPPSNHLDTPTRRPTVRPLPPRTTTPDSVEVNIIKDTVTSRPPIVEVQFPRDPTPRPTIPPAIPTLYPIVPPTTQRRPIVVNNHHKKPSYPLKGTTLSPTLRPRPTEEMTTMAITEVPTGNPTWIVADEADKNGHPTSATSEATPPTSFIVSTTVSSGTTGQPPSTVATTEAVPVTTTTTVSQTDYTTETTQQPTEETTQTTTVRIDTTTQREDLMTTTTTTSSPIEDLPKTTTTTTVASHEENSIDVTTAPTETTTRIFSTRYPIRFPPKDKPTTTTTTTEEPDVTPREDFITEPEVVEVDMTQESTSEVSSTTTEHESTTATSDAYYPSSTAAATETSTAPTTTTEAASTEPPRTTPAATTAEQTTTTTVPSTTLETIDETTTTPIADTTTEQQQTTEVTESTTEVSTETPTETTSGPTTTTTSFVPTETTAPPTTITTTTTAAPETTTTTSTSTTTTLVPETTTEYDPIKAICGRPKSFPSGRIVGGDLTRFGKWPWMISLRQFKKNTFVHKCGAALLNEYWAVSAAHCVHNVSPNDILLRLGEYDLSGHDKEPLGHIERRVQIVATHPKFDAHTFEYDLALMRFYEPVSFADNIVPICIADRNQSYVGQTAVVTGWGRLYEDGPLPSVLQKVQVPIITNKECERMYRKAGFIEDIPDIFICAGLSSGGKDSCEGDSGGPLVLRDEDNGSWNLIGIISWGIGCAVPNQPGVYTRITKFADWMKQIIVF